MASAYQEVLKRRHDGRAANWRQKGERAVGSLGPLAPNDESQAVVLQNSKPKTKAVQCDSILGRHVFKQKFNTDRNPESIFYYITNLEVSPKLRLQRNARELKIAVVTLE